MDVNIIKNYETMECYKCGIIFAVSSKFINNLKETKQTFYCPNGHSQGFTKSTSEILKKEIELKNKDIEFFKSEIDKLKKPKRGRPKKK